MTFISCLLLGLAFAIAVLLLALAGALIGWNLPRLLSSLRRPRGAQGASGRRPR